VAREKSSGGGGLAIAEDMTVLIGEGSTRSSEYSTARR
jgi:hypothetical protein